MRVIVSVPLGAQAPFRNIVRESLTGWLTYVRRTAAPRSTTVVRPFECRRGEARTRSGLHHTVRLCRHIVHPIRRPQNRPNPRQPRLKGCEQVGRKKGIYGGANAGINRFHRRTSNGVRWATHMRRSAWL